MTIFQHVHIHRFCLTDAHLPEELIQCMMADLARQLRLAMITQRD
jgi:hypothetical protein